MTTPEQKRWNHSYYIKNRDSILASKKEYYKRNKERIKARQRAYYTKNNAPYQNKGEV